MATDPTIDYWREALADALEDAAGVAVTLTAEQQALAAARLAEWADHQSTAFGEDCIPEPRDRQHAEELAAVRRDLDAARAAHEAEVREYQARVRELHRQRDRYRDGGAR